jgi:hypothetical protein
MKKALIFIAILMVGLIGISTISGFDSGNYIKIIEPTSSFTKAICTENNFCQDYYILCENKKVISRSLITGAAVQFSPDWKDPRSEEFRNKMC